MKNRMGLPESRQRNTGKMQRSRGYSSRYLTMINAYNKALSEKANDVDYFADAYLKVLGALSGRRGDQAHPG